MSSNKPKKFAVTKLAASSYEKVKVMADRSRRSNPTQLSMIVDAAWEKFISDQLEKYPTLEEVER